MSSSPNSAAHATAVPAITAAPAGMLQRQCACGEHTVAGGECEECKKKEMPLQRQALGAARPAALPASVHRTLSSDGHPLNADVRGFMEPRFGQDFSRVRVHTDARAAESARSVNALAYSVGDHIAFQSGVYNPATTAGRHLLAHELTHVVQSRKHRARSAGSAPAVSDPGDASEREAGGVARQIMSGGSAQVSASPHAAVHRISISDDTAHGLEIGGAIVGGGLAALGIAALAGAFISDSDLQKYLQKIDDTNKIEGGFQSDQKARRIAESWGKGETKFTVTIRRKPLMILEMLDGHVSHWDKDGIMNILERSDDIDLNYIFGPGGVSHQTLIAKLDSWKDEVGRFYKRRYKGVDIHTVKDFSVLKAENTEPIQPGDDIPGEETEDSPPPGTKRRTKRNPVRAAESDQWVTELYGPYLAKDKASGGYIEKQVDMNIAENQGDSSADEQFANALEPQCRQEREWYKQQKKKENGGKPLTPAQKQDADARFEYCTTRSNTAGFYQSAEEADAKKPQIWIHSGRESATTRLHESLHAYAAPDVAHKLPHFASEGMTEYFTRQIALRKNLAISDSYDGPFNAMQEFSVRFGEDTMKQVYFQGQITLICSKLVQRFGEGAYKDWSAAMTDQETWADAVAVMQRPVTTKPPKDPEECKL